MSRLATQYGITGNGLAKICDRLNIPYPPRGYWAKKAAGKKIVTFRLPEPDRTMPSGITINPTPAPPKTAELSPEVAQAAAAARSAEISVPDRLVRPHSIIAARLADHERRKREARLERDPWRKKLLYPGEFTDIDRRQHRILDSLFKALERQGAKVHESERGLLIAEVDGERVEFQLREKTRQIRIPLTDEEKRWRSNKDGYRQELQPTGRLVLAIKTYLPPGARLRTEWLETDSQPLESTLGDVVATFVAAWPLLAERTHRRQEEERERRIAEEKRREEEQRQRREDNRWRHFVRIARAWQDAKLAREFLAAMKACEFEASQQIGDSSVADWIAWAEERIQTVDPIGNGPAAIFTSVTNVNEWNYRE